VEDSLKRLQLETLDLVQLHCPPTQVFYRPEIFGLFEDLKAEGKVQNLGISVEKIEEALKGIEFDNVVSVQIIFNMLRQRPAELFFEQAKKKDVGVIVRVPLASGLLTGKYSKDTSFEVGDHRFFNRNGEMFDKGETFSGIDYNTGLEAVAEFGRNSFEMDFDV
jgi:aryl-alcohol dehydrogenase-like predicted oxidoreductase